MMCRSYDPAVTTQCTEDDAEEVLDKRLANFCEWFAPSNTAFDPEAARLGKGAEQRLAALFESDTVDATTTKEGDHAADVQAAEDLFK